MHEWIRAARKHKELNQEQLGELLGVSKANVSAWETGKHEASFGQLQAIEAATGYPLLPHDAQMYERPNEPDFSDSDRALLQDLHALTHDKQEEIRRLIRASFEEAKAATEAFMRSQGYPGPIGNDKLGRGFRSIRHPDASQPVDRLLGSSAFGELEDEDKKEGGKR